ncbi:MAG: cache domain-containing protein [Deltaproteobacteria bacterium]|nr:cache domain-containing protein [Deltaproteobacteria bacterium]
MAAKISLSKSLQLWGIVFLLAVGGSVVALDIALSCRDFQVRTQELRRRYIERQKAAVKLEVDQVIAEISYERSLSEKLTRDEIEARVNEAYAIVEHIYFENRGRKSDLEIERMMLEALRPIRYDNGLGYYFVVRRDGMEMLFADRPELEGRNLLAMHDPQGQFVIKDIISIAERQGAGFYAYHWTKPGVAGENFKKISYVKLFAPYGWVLGSGLYVEDVEARIQDNLLSAISRIRFGAEGYVFVNRFNGDALVSNGQRFSGAEKLWQVFSKDEADVKTIFEKEYQAAARLQGDYIEYEWETLTDSDRKAAKISFIAPVPEWQWLIGAGFSVDAVESDIALMRGALSRQIRQKIIIFALLVAGIVAFFVFFLSFFNRRLKNDFKLFLEFFQRALHEDTAIDRNQLKFIELDQLAEQANQLLFDKGLVRQELFNEKEALRQSEIKYRELVENSPDVHYQTDLEGKIIYISSSVNKLSGYSSAELSGGFMAEFYVHPEERNRFLEVLQREGSVTDFTAQLKRKDGSLWWASTNAHLLKDADGRITGVEGVCRDVTEREQAERALAQSQNKFRLMMESMSDPVYIRSADYHIEYMNPAMCQRTGRDAKGELCYKALHEFDQPCSWCQDQEQYFEMDIISPKDSHSYHISFAPLFNEDGTVSKMIILRDTTALKKLEEQLIQTQKMESIGNLAGGVAHDFNNLLTVINMHAECIQADLAEGSDLWLDVDEIRQAGERAANLTRQLLAFSRKQTIVPRSLNCNKVITDLGKMLQRLISEDICLELNLKEDVGRIYADPGQLEQILVNLVVNARDAVKNQPDAAAKRIKISTAQVFLDQSYAARHPGSASGWHLQLQVDDSGCGMAQDVVSHIFEPFYTTKEVGQGTGMGLATVYGIVKQNQGSIYVYSEPGQGTTFKIYWPLSKDESGGEPEDQDENVAIPGGGETILLAEDEAQLRGITARQLRQGGYTVIEAENGQMALAEAAKQKPQGEIALLFTDVVMPRMGGKELSEKIKALYPEIVTLFASGYTDDHLPQDLAGLDDAQFINKPYSRRDIMVKIRELLDKKAVADSV